MKIRSIFRVMVVGTISGLLIAVKAQAKDDYSPEQVKRWVDQGVIRSIASLREEHSTLLEGRFLDAELEEKKGRWIYELEILGPDGRVREFKLDAESGEVLKQEIED